MSEELKEVEKKEMTQKGLAELLLKERQKDLEKCRAKVQVALDEYGFDMSIVQRIEIVQRRTSNNQA